MRYSMNLQVASDRNAPVLDAPADFVRTVVVTDEALFLLDVYRSDAPSTVAWTLHPGTGIQVPAEWDRAAPPVDSPGWRYGIVKDWRKDPLPGTGWRIGLTSGSPAQEVFLRTSVPCNLSAFAYPTGHRMTGSRTSLALVSEGETSAAVWGAVIPFGPGASMCEAVALVHGEPGAPVTLEATINGKPIQVSVSPAKDFQVDVGP
jgi:hypothetical protein